jgi:hypothetical protein
VLPHNKPLQRTPLRVEQDRAFLKAGFGSTVFPIYDAAPLNGKPLARLASYHLP